MGVERLTTLLDLMHLTNGAAAEGTLRRRRNIRSLAVLMQSTLVEMAEALDGISKARVVTFMNDPTLWEPLEAKRKLWDNDLNLRAIRNGVGHHFGELADYRTGLTKLLEKSDRLTFVVGEGRRRVDDEQELAWNVLLASLGESSKLRRAMIDADHEHVNDITRRALDETHEQLWFVWFDVLDRAGIGRLDATSERLLADLLDAAAEVGLEPTTWLTAARQRMGV